MRVDQWLWYTRFYRTRSLAADAVKAGHVKVEGQRCKPAKEIEAGAMLTIGKGEESWSVTVTALPERRGPATQARECYVEDPASIAQRAEQRRQRRLAAYEPPTPGWPDKRTRRMIRAQRGRS